jgi:hypothetical protein
MKQDILQASDRWLLNLVKTDDRFSAIYRHGSLQELKDELDKHILYSLNQWTVLKLDKLQTTINNA